MVKRRGLWGSGCKVTSQWGKEGVLGVVDVRLRDSGEKGTWGYGPLGYEEVKRRGSLGCGREVTGWWREGVHGVVGARLRGNRVGHHHHQQDLLIIPYGDSRLYWLSKTIAR